MSAANLALGVEYHVLEGVRVPIFSVGKTIADCFRYRNSIMSCTAVEALVDAIRKDKCTRMEIYEFAKPMGVWKEILPCILVLNELGF